MVDGRDGVADGVCEIVVEVQYECSVNVVLSEKARNGLAGKFIKGE